MSFEKAKDTNELRADEVMRLIHEGICKDVPTAVRKILRDELITHEPDVKRIMEEIGTLLARRKQILYENKMIDELEAELRTEEAALMQKERGGDPED